MMKGLKAKVAIVAGACAGIGAATAKRLVEEGARVVLADINITAAEQVASELASAGGEAVAHYFDLMDESSIQDLIKWTVEKYGALNILHNNAADTRAELVASDIDIADMSIDTWDRAFQANARGTMLLIKHAIPEMLKAGGGSIINTSSGKSLRGDLTQPAYAASKSAINCLTMYVATRYGRRGIRCNAVSPGLILTPTVLSVIPEEDLHQMRNYALLSDLGVAEDIAAAVVFLASDDARNITGHVIPVDGGYTVQHPHVNEMLEALEG